jgi:hypothetical protein
VDGDRSAPQGRVETGLVIDSFGMRVLQGTQPMPARVRTLDGICLAFHHGTRFDIDPEMGFHFYDADICLQAEKKGMPVVALEACLFHSSVFVGPGFDFDAAAIVFREKWKDALPMEVPCALITKEG